MALKDQTDDLLSKENVKDAAMFGAEFIPGVGEALAIKRTSDALDKKDYLGAGIEATAGLLGVIPVVGDVAGKSLRVATKKFRRKDIEDAAPSWFKETKVSKDIKPEDAQKTQITTTTATYEKAKSILPEGNTLDFGAGKGVGAKKVGSDTYEPFADKSFSPTYTDAKAIPSNSYNNVTSLNVLNVVKPETRSEIVQDIGRILKPGGTGIITTRGMDVFGNSKNPVRGILADEPRAVITSSGTYQKGFTQKELREYIADELGESFTVSDVSGLGKAGVKIKKKSNNLDMAEGGTVMDRQMELFEDGGLMDEGGTVDPVSGNDVPPGSTQEEVRDDIPAQLSEGEFVFPADVVRYIGLGNLMRMRQEAKMGLKLMDEMGQMGNSDEATMPDDLPFDINDLDMEDEPEYNVGGFVPAQQQQQQFGIAGYTPAQQPTTGFVQQPTQAASQQFVQPTAPVAAAAVPTMQQYTPAELPSFQSFVGGEFGGYDELREYRNEAGNVIQVPFKDGQPISPIPEGYTFVDPEAIATEEVTTTPTTPQTTSVRDTSDSDERRRKEEEEMYGPGGGRLGVDGTIYGVSFDTAEGGLPGVGGALSIAGGLFSGKGLPKGATATIKRKGLEFTVTADEYNKLKSSIEEDGANSPATATLFEEIKQQALERKGTAAQQRFLDSLEEDTDDDDKDDDATKYSLTKKQLDDYAESYSGVTDFSFGDSSPPPAPKPEPAPPAPAPKDDNDSPSGGNQYSMSNEEANDYADSFSDVTDYSFGNKGMLVTRKKKPKAKKQMKRGGLASKK